MGVKVGNNKKTNKSNNNNKKSKPNGGNNKETAFSGPSKRSLGGYQLDVYNSNMSKAASTYKAALLEPFSDSAIGCRVPDQYFCPTATYAVREFLTIKVDSFGSFDVVICPNPLYVAWSSRNSIANGVTLTTKDGTTYGSAMYTNPSTALMNKLSSYRVVSWGVRVRQTQSVNVTQGTLTAALFVPKDGLYHPSMGSTAGPVGNQSQVGTSWSTSTLSAYIQDAGLPVTTTGLIDTGSLVDLPYHMRASCVNAAENTYEISPKLCSPTALHFRDTNDSLFGTDITGQTSTVYVQPGDASYLLADGWTNIVLAGNGLVANSSGAVDIEIVYNIEGNPFISAGAASNIAVATGVKSVCDPLGALLAQAALDIQPGFRLLSLARTAFKAFSGRG